MQPFVALKENVTLLYREAQIKLQDPEVLYSSGRKMIRHVMQAYFSMSVFGLEQIPATGGVLLTAGHSAYTDIPFLGIHIDRQIYFIAKSSLMERTGPIGGFFSWYLRAIGTISYDRNNRAAIVAMRSAKERLEQGELVGIFPEGTRQRDTFTHPFNTGAAYLAKKTGVPIIPIGLIGTHKRLPRSRIEMVIGEPLEAADSLEATTEELRKRISALSGYPLTE